MSTPQTDSPTDSSPDPETWLLSNLPHTTFSEDAFAYLDTGSGHSTQFYSIDWLAEEFGEIIASADRPKQRLISAGVEHGPAELRRLFEQIDEKLAPNRENGRAIVRWAARYYISTARDCIMNGLIPLRAATVGGPGDRETAVVPAPRGVDEY